MSAPEIKTAFGYRRSADQDAVRPAHYPVIIVGAGPVGLCLAIDLAQRGRNVVLLDDADRIGTGSRAICFAKRTLEIFDRLGVGDRMVDKGVTWRKGKVFQGPSLLYEFDLLPEGGHKRPAFINLQQYYVETFLVERAAQLPQIDLRWKNRVAGVAQRSDHVALSIETPQGVYEMTCDWLIACDGARSSVRGLLGVAFAGETFEDRFLIADVKMTADFPTERWFWFDPPFHPGKSALLHKQPDDVWRVDLQLGVEADAERERRPENVRRRIERMLGRSDFDLEWVSIYRFQCRRLDRFVHDRVIFAGDSAHQVSPFGARGANSGIQDADNLGWKLALVLTGDASPSLLDSYDSERAQAADENIRHSTRSTDFIAPHSAFEERLRNAALGLARHADFAKRFVNSGRLSTATHYIASPLSTPDAAPWSGGVPPGAPLVDAPLVASSGGARWLSDLVGQGFTLVGLGIDGSSRSFNGASVINVSPAGVGDRPLVDADALLAVRYGLSVGGGILFRPDGHVAARFAAFDPKAATAAIRRAKNGS
jgi:3-(3-hydroxy-phenyl)propionate hydroxylase